MKRFPCGQYGRQKLQFFAAPYRAPIRAFAALVFPWHGDQIVLCNIADRGWCIPSGRVEPYENSLEAARREAVEEGGLVLSGIQYIGCYHISERHEVRWADCFAARVERFEEIQMCEESLGRQLYRLEEIGAIYHVWNELTELVFQHSKAVIDRRGCL